jgi:gliding motility-associated-like protein
MHNGLFVDSPAVNYYYQNKKGFLNGYESKTLLAIGGIAIGDVNGDNLNDIIATQPWETNTAGVQILLQNKKSNTIENPYLIPYYYLNTVEVADLNCDGVDEIVANTSISILILDHNQNQTILDNTDINNGSPYDLSIGDINNDGKPDIIEGSNVNISAISIFINTTIMDTACCPKPPRINKPIGDTLVCPFGINSTYYNKTKVQDSVRWMIIPSEAGTLLYSSKDSCKIAWNDSWNGVAKLYLRLYNSCGKWVNSLVLGVVVRKPKIDLTNDTTYCVTESTLLNAYCEKCTSYLWQDGTSLPQYNVQKEGVYTVSVTNNCSITVDTITVKFIDPPIIKLPNDTFICKGTILKLDATDIGIVKYNWQDSITNPQYLIQTSGQYSLRILDSNKCSTQKTINVLEKGKPTIQLPKDSIYCNTIVDVPILLTDASASFLWQDNSISQSYIITKAGLYSVTATNNCGAVTDSVHIGVALLPTIQLPTDTLLCSGKTIQINVSLQAKNKYLWQDNATKPLYTIFNAGTYSVSVTDSNNCKASKTMVVHELAAPQFRFPNDSVVCDEIQLPIDVSCKECLYVWNNGNETSKYIIVSSGMYSITVSNDCGIVKDSVRITVKDCKSYLDVPTAFSPNGDGLNDVLYAEGRNIENFSFIIYDRWGQKIFESNNVTEGWDGSFKGKTLEAATFMYFISATATSDGKKIEKKGNVTLIR